MRSALYEGRVWHERRRPRRHALAYRVAMVLVDLAELETLGRRLRLFGSQTGRLVSVRERDHLDPKGGPLADQVRAVLARHGRADPARVSLLCMPRVVGSGFNPLSLYFCEDAAGRVEAVLYEVNNTFGERHAYLLGGEGDGGEIAHDCDKTFYVSPFNGMEMRYAFRVTPPSRDLGSRLRVQILARDADGPLLAASFTGVRSPLDDRGALRAALRHPFLGAKVLLAIHLEALKLWMKGVRLTQRPPPPADPVTAPRPLGP